MGGPVSNTAKSFEQAFIEANQNPQDRKTPGAEKPKGVNTVQIWKEVFHNEFEKSNLNIRRALSDRRGKTHLEKTQEMILKGASHLTKDSVVVVVGAQYCGKKFVEPLEKLVEMCKQLILVDYDLSTLNTLKNRLNSDKVIIRHVDVSCGINEEFTKLGSILETTQDQTKGKKLFRIFYDNITNTTAIAKMMAKLPDLRNKILGEAGKADYVISSLVASELFSSVIKAADFISDRIFKIKRSGDLVIGTPIADNVRLLFPAIIMTHIDLALFLAKPLTGRVYFADTTKTLKNLTSPLMTRLNGYEEIIPLINGLKCHKEQQSWLWDYREVVFKVDAWILSNFEVNTTMNPPDLYIGAKAFYKEERSTSESQKGSSATVSVAATAAAAETVARHPAAAEEQTVVAKATAMNGATLAARATAVGRAPTATGATAVAVPATAATRVPTGSAAAMGTGVKAAETATFNLHDVD